MFTSTDPERLVQHYAFLCSDLSATILQNFASQNEGRCEAGRKKICYILHMLSCSVLPPLFVIARPSSSADGQLLRVLLFAQFSILSIMSARNSIAVVIMASNLIKEKRLVIADEDPLYFKNFSMLFGPFLFQKWGLSLTH